MKLRVEDMAISFDNRKILEHVGFHVEEGEFTALIGPSGWKVHIAEHTGRAFGL